jgi:hypothetical protein
VKALLIALLVLLGLLLVGCGVATDAPASDPSPGQFGAPCGFDQAGVDHGQCSDGLECFDTCSVNCESQEGIDECAARQGKCEQYAPGVQINVCKLEAVSN